MKDRARGEEGWASHWGFTNCHSEEGERVCFKERSCWSVLWIGSLFQPPPRRRLDKYRTSCTCYGRKRRKCAVSLGRPAASQEIRETSGRNGPARCLWWCVCVSLCVRYVVQADMSLFIYPCVLINCCYKKKPVIDLIKAFSWLILFAFNLFRDQIERGNLDQRCEATGWDLITAADESSVITLSNEFDT